MSDLFSEIYEERAAIHEHEAGLDRATAETMAAASTERYRHACEVRDVVRMYREQGKAVVVQFLGDVEKHRGKAARDRLEADALRSISRRHENDAESSCDPD